jgi:tRNA A-37 threonylcarbamoyl transferase component Bud32
MAPEKIGRYEIRSELGRGGMSTVYHAYDPNFKRDVAIKVLPREFMHDQLFQSRFEREAETIAALEHPAIVPVYDYGQDADQMFLVMRYMSGGSLADIIEHGPIPLEQCVSILERVAPGLDKAHAMNVVHRDMKSANILFDEDGNAFLADFGIAKLNESGAGSLTGTGSMIGTPAYMSPEQARGDPSTDGRSDIYALGVILFEMLSGELPFSADTPMGIAVKHITDPVPRILSLRPDLPPRCEAVISRAMAKDAAGRYQTAGDLVRDLRSGASMDLGGQPTVQSSFGTAGVTTAQLPAVKLKVPGTNWNVVIGAVAVVVLVVAALLLFGGDLPGFSLTIASTTAIPAGTTVKITSTPRPTLPPIGGGDGTMLLVSGPPSGGNIYLLNTGCANSAELCSSGLIQLTVDLQDVRSPNYNRDGSKIVFRAVSESGDRNVYVMDADGTNLKQLTNDPAQDYSPSWSPDGTRILFVSERDGNPELYAMDASGNNQTRLTSNDVPDYYPIWSPDGTKILFHSRRDLNTDIYMVDAACVDKGNCNVGNIRLTTDAGGDFEASWSPDSSQIVFVSERNGNPDIFIMDSDGSHQTALTNDVNADNTPAWSYDGNMIAFVSRRNNQVEIYLINTDGTKERQMTDIPGENLDPTWHP